MTSARSEEPAVSMAGAGGLLMDCAGKVFDEQVQRRIWSVSTSAIAVEGMRETVPGMNNLLVLFDPLVLPMRDAEALLRRLWKASHASETAGKTVDIAVEYGGQRGEDLLGWAAHCGLSVEEAVRRHSSASYMVAAVGAMPGFPYLSGLDPSLAWGRRATPRDKVIEGSVIIGGAQAGMMPQTAPSGWHIIGHASVKLFDPAVEPPTLLQPGDIVRFTIAGIHL